MTELCKIAECNRSYVAKLFKRSSSAIDIKKVLEKFKNRRCVDLIYKRLPTNSFDSINKQSSVLLFSSGKGAFNTNLQLNKQKLPTGI